MQQKQNFINLELKIFDPFKVNKNFYVQKIEGEKERVLAKDLWGDINQIIGAIIYQNGFKKQELKWFAQSRQNLRFLKEWRKIWLCQTKKFEKIYNPNEISKVIKEDKEETDINDIESLKNTYSKIKTLTRRKSLEGLTYLIERDISSLLKSINGLKNHGRENWSLIINESDYEEIKKLKIKDDWEINVKTGKSILPGEYLIAIDKRVFSIKPSFLLEKIKENKEAFGNQTLEAVVQLYTENLWIKRRPEKFRAADSFYIEHMGRSKLVSMKIKNWFSKHWITIFVASVAIAGIVMVVLGFIVDS